MGEDQIVKRPKGFPDNTRTTGETIKGQNVPNNICPHEKTYYAHGEGREQTVPSD